MRMPRVYLEKKDYQKGVTYTDPMGDTRTSIFINGIQGEYSVTNMRGNVYTTDSDGNQKNRSCFNLK